jgi:hypothetical protein
MVSSIITSTSTVSSATSNQPNAYTTSHATIKTPSQVPNFFMVNKLTNIIKKCDMQVLMNLLCMSRKR